MGHDDVVGNSGQILERISVDQRLDASPVDCSEEFHPPAVTDADTRYGRHLEQKRGDGSGNFNEVAWGN